MWKHYSITRRPDKILLNKTEVSINFTVELEYDHKFALLNTEIIQHLDDYCLQKLKTYRQFFIIQISHNWHTKSLWLRNYFPELIISVAHFQIVFLKKTHIATALKVNNYLADIVTRNTRVKYGIHSDVEEVKPAAIVILPYVKHILEGVRRIVVPLNILTCLNQIE